MKRVARKKFEALTHSKVHGFYCKDTDMYFEDLNDWLSHHGYTWLDVSN